MSINTKCEKCVFKILDEQNRQCGCHFDVPNKILSLSPIYKTEQIVKTDNFWKINNFYCPYARIKEWADIIVSQNKDIAQAAQEESNMGYYLSIIVDDVSRVCQLTKDINNMTYKPNLVSFVYGGSESSSIIKNIEKEKPLFKWKLHTSLQKHDSSLDAVSLAASTNLNARHILFAISYASSLSVQVIDNAINIFTHCINKKIIVGKNMDLNKHSFEFLMFPNSLFSVANKNIITCCDMINRDSKESDLYIVDLAYA